MIIHGLSLDTAFPGNLPENFSSALAMPANLMQGGEWPENLTRPAFRIINDPADAQFCRIMPEESFRVRMNFLREMSRELRRLNDLPVQLAVLTMDSDRIAADPEFAEKAIDLLRSLRSVLPTGGMRIGVRLRLPHPAGAAAVVDFLLLLQAVSGLRGVLEIHPHEPAFAAWDPAWLRPLRMLSPITEIVYDRTLGNRITPKLLSPLMAELQGSPLDTVVLFRPGCTDTESLTMEAEELAAMANAKWQYPAAQTEVEK